MAAFPRFARFDGADYSLFGANKRALPLSQMLRIFPEAAAHRREIGRLKWKGGLLWLWYQFRWTMSFVGLSGVSLTVSLAWLWSDIGVFQPNGVGTTHAQQMGLAISVSLMLAMSVMVVRGLWRDSAGRGDFFGVIHDVKPALKNIRNSSQVYYKRIESLSADLAVITGIPEPTRALVADLVALIAAHNANVELYNAEAERSEFYVKRGHADQTAEEQRLQALHETLGVQRQEIIETLMAADRACIAIVCQPRGSGALITPNLEVLREHLNALGEKVSQPLIDEGVIRRELAPLNDTEFARRLAASKLQKSQV